MLALIVAVVGAAGFLVIRHVVNSDNAQSARANLAAAEAAVEGLHVPSDFVRVSMLGDRVPCLATTCYRVAEPTIRMAPVVRRLLRSIGAVYVPKCSECTRIRALAQSPGAPAFVANCVFGATVDHQAIAIDLHPPFRACARCSVQADLSEVLVNGPVSSS